MVAMVIPRKTSSLLISPILSNYTYTCTIRLDMSLSETHEAESKRHTPGNSTLKTFRDKETNSAI